MDIHLGTAAYDIRFERQKAAQDIAGIEAEWNAALERIRSKASGIIGFGGGGGGGGTHNGAVAGGGQPVSQVAANGNGASRASAAVNGAASQNDLLAAAAKNPMLRAAYFSANQATIAPSMAAQLGVTTQQLADAMTGGGGGASAATKGINVAQVQQHSSSVVGDIKQGGGSNNVAGIPGGKTIPVYVVNWPKGGGSGRSASGASANDSDVGESTQSNAEKGTMSLLRRFGPLAIGMAGLHTAAGVASTQRQFLMDSVGAANDPLRQHQADLERKRGFVRSIPLAGGIADSIAGSVSGLDREQAEIERLINVRSFSETGMRIDAATRGNQISSTSLRLTRSPHLAGLLSNQGNYQESVGKLEADERAARRSLPYEKDSNGNIIRNRHNDDLTSEHNRRFSDLGGMARRNLLNANEGIRSEMRMENSSLYASITQKEYSAQLRPTQGFAIAIKGQALSQFEEEKKQAAAARAAGANPDDVAAAIDLARARVKDARGTLEVERTGVLKNIYGGRPEEIGGFQSVEARRDISPETNEAKFDALTKAIEALTDALKKP